MAGTVSTSLAPGANGPRTAACAIVLEDRPTGIDARMPFESFEQEIEEAYALDGYQEYAKNRMPQPGYAAYRGGNWSAMNLTLHFRADGTFGSPVVEGKVPISEIDGILIDMERKVRWFEALGFPLRRSASAFADRQIARAQAAGLNVLPATQKALRSQVRNDPPIVLIVFGSFLVVRGYIMSVALRWQPPFHPVSVRPYGCTVTLSFQRIDASYPTWRSIRNSAGGSESTPKNITGTVKLNAEADRKLRAAQASVSNAARAGARDKVEQSNILVTPLGGG